MLVHIDIVRTRANADLLAARVTTASGLEQALLGVDSLLSTGLSGYTAATRRLLGEYQSEVGDASTLMHAVADAAERADSTDWTVALDAEFRRMYGSTVERLNASVRDEDGYKVTDRDIRDYYEGGESGDSSAGDRAAVTLAGLHPDDIDNYWDALPPHIRDKVAQDAPGVFVDTVLNAGLPVTPEQISAIAENPEYADDVAAFLADGGRIRIDDDSAQTATDRAIIALTDLSGPAFLLYWNSLGATQRQAILASGSDVVGRLAEADADFSDDELAQLAIALDEQAESGGITLSGEVVDPNGVATKLAALANGGSIGSQVIITLTDGSQVAVKLAKFVPNAAGALAVIGACSDGGADECAAAATMFIVDTAASAVLTPLGWAALKQVAKLALPYIQGPNVPTPAPTWPGSPPGELPYDTSRGPIIDYGDTPNGANPNGTVVYGN